MTSSSSYNDFKSNYTKGNINPNVNNGKSLLMFKKAEKLLKIKIRDCSFSITAS